jgi:glyoxylase-like metal-dependent hydrolase (beta-lactamase superfamily II)
VSLVVEVIEPDVLRLRMRSWQGMLAGYEVSAYMVRGVLIDTGFPRAAAELRAALEARAPRGAVVTHWHEDHAGNAPSLASRGLPMLMHRECETRLRARPRIRAYRHLVWGATARLEAPLQSFDPAPLEIIHLPGHTRDHLVVWDAEQKVLVSGDLFLGVKVRVAHESESPRTLLSSLRTAAALEPRLLLDAHRGPLTDAASKLRAKADWLEGTIAEIESLGMRGDPERAIARRVLGREALVGWASWFEYSKIGLVRAVLRGVRGAQAPGQRSSAVGP